MQNATFNPLPAGARALTVDETAVVVGGNPLGGFIIGFVMGVLKSSSSSSSCSCSCECSSGTQESQQEPESTSEP